MLASPGLAGVPAYCRMSSYPAPLALVYLEAALSVGRDPKSPWRSTRQKARRLEYCRGLGLSTDAV